MTENRWPDGSVPPGNRVPPNGGHPLGGYPPAGAPQGGFTPPAGPPPSPWSPEAARQPRSPDPVPQQPGTPLTELPIPPSDQVPAGAIMLESNRELLRRLVRRLPSAIWPLLGLWIAFVIMYFVTVGPVSMLMLFISLLVEPESIGMYLAYMRFRPGDLIVLFLVVPVVGTVLSLACVLLSARWAGQLRPDRFLGEREFQDAFAFRAALPLLLPALAAAALALLLVLPGTPTVHWNALSPGAVGTLCAAGLLLRVTHRALARRFAAWRVLGIDSAELVAHHAHSATTPAERRRAAAFSAEDVRPNPPEEPLPPGLRQRAVIVLTQRLCGAPLITGAAIMVVLGWGADIVRGFSQLGSLASGGFGAVVPPSASAWPAVGLLAAGYAVLAAAVAATAPRLVSGAARHGQALLRWRLETQERQRSYGAPIGGPAHPLLDTHVPVTEAASWFLMRRGALFDLVALPVQVVIAVVCYLLPNDGFVYLQTIALGIVFLVARRVIREDVGGELLDVAYGSARRFVRRPIPFQLVAPAQGTRSQLAEHQRRLGIAPAPFGEPEGPGAAAPPGGSALIGPAAANGSPLPGTPPGELPDFGRRTGQDRTWRPDPPDPTEIPPRL